MMRDHGMRGMGLGILAALLIPCAPAASQEEAWSRGPGGPGARMKHALVWDPGGRRLLLYGGLRLPGFVGKDDLWAYPVDAEEPRWSRLTTGKPRPGPRRGFAHAMDRKGRRLYVHGGFYERGLDDLWVFDAAEERWSEVRTEGPRPAPREDHTLTWIPDGERLLLVGGMLDTRQEGGARTPGRVSKEVWVCRPAEGRWRRLKDAAHGRHLHAAAWDARSGLLLVFGGGGLKDAAVWTFDPGKERWKRGPEGPGARAGMSAAWMPEARSFVLLGGQGAGRLVADAWAFEVAGGRVRRLRARLPDRRFLAAACHVPDPGILFVHGGALRRDWSREAPDVLLSLPDPLR